MTTYALRLTAFQMGKRDLLKLLIREMCDCGLPWRRFEDGLEAATADLLLGQTAVCPVTKVACVPERTVRVGAKASFQKKGTVLQYASDWDSR